MIAIPPTAKTCPGLKICPRLATFGGSGCALSICKRSSPAKNRARSWNDWRGVIPGCCGPCRKLGDSQVVEMYLTALGNAYDPHSVYLGPSNFEDLNIGMRLSLVGIGAELSMEDGYTIVRRVLPGPAARSGQLKPGDRITAVARDGKTLVDVMDMPLPKVVELIRGPEGSPVRLTVLPVRCRRSRGPQDYHARARRN